MDSEIVVGMGTAPFSVVWIPGSWLMWRWLHSLGSSEVFDPVLQKH